MIDFKVNDTRIPVRIYSIFGTFPKGYPSITPVDLGVITNISYYWQRLMELRKIQKPEDGFPPG